MRTLPEFMAIAFKEQQGVNLHFVIAINWMGVEEIWYSDCEFDTYYAYVKEATNYQSISHVEGLGSVSSLNVTFYDQFGHFKEKIDTVDFFASTTVTVYLTLDGTELFDLFEGKITDGATWQDNLFNIEIVSNPIDREIGYQPSIDDVADDDPNFDSLEKRMVTGKAWPTIFGEVKNYEAALVRAQRHAETQRDVPYAASGTVYDLLLDDHDDFTLDTTYQVNIVGKNRDGFSILGEGQFKTVTYPAEGEEPEIPDAPIFRLTKAGVTSKWYENIAFTIISETGISGETDNIKTRIELEPGDVVIDGDTLTTLGPTGDPTTFVWAQFMKLEVRYTYTVGAATVSNSRYVNCIHQSGNICTLNEQLTLHDDAYDIYIRSVFKANDIIYSIPSGSKIYILGDRLHYVVDTKEDTTVTRVGFKNGEKIQIIDPTAYDVSSAALWTGSFPPATYIHMQAEVYMRFLEHFELSDQPIIVTCSNELITDQLAIAHMAGLDVVDDNPKATSFIYESVEQADSVIPEVAWQANKGIRFSRVDGDDVVELIDLTTPGPVLHVFNDTNVLRNSVIYGFTEKDNVYTVFKGDFQTNDLEKKLETIKLKKNVDKYEEIVYETDYYIFKQKASAKTSLEFWRDKLSQYYYTVELTGFLDAFALEVWDRVAIELSDLSFYDPALGSPFTNTHTATPLSWSASGRVKSMSPDLKTGLVQFRIELDTILGDSPTSPYEMEF